MASIDIRGVSKIYPGAQAASVADIDLSIRDGEFIVLVGPSGCGKSTTLRMIAGLESVSDGTVSIGGRDVTRLQPKDRNIAMVFQNYALYAHKTVRANLAFGLRMRGTPRAETARRVQAAARCWASPTSWSASPSSSPAGSGSASPWPAPWCASPTSSCWTSR